MTRSSRDNAWIDRRGPAAVSLSLAALVFSVFARTLWHGFVNYDDGQYVYQNPHLLNGFSWRGIAWAFTGGYASNWHPLTWLTHMADCQVYGLHPGGHHLGNLLLHLAVTLLLFHVLREMTGALWQSAFVAAIFAIHPLRVESVAWVAERKDVLSGLFFMLTLWAYTRYTRTLRRCKWYALVAIFFGLGLMSKPSVVTVPFVLLLLDYWPLGRVDAARTRGREWRLDSSEESLVPRPKGSLRQLLLEKAPLLAMSIASCCVTVSAQTKAIMPINKLPLASRLSNACWSYVAYLWQMIDPARLAVLYPLQIPPWWVAAFSLALLVAISAAAILLRRKARWFVVGWLWYLGMLIPMIGVMQVGSQSRADRYTYLPGIGILIAAIWSVAAAYRVRWYRQWVLGGAGAVVVLALAIEAGFQVSYWRNSEMLWRHTIACTSRNAVAHNLLAVALVDEGRRSEGIAEFRRALRIQPNDAGTHNHMGVSLAKQGDLDEAIQHLRRSLELNPGDAGAECDLGLALASRGETKEAIDHYRKSLKLDPDFAYAQNNLAWALATAPDPAVRRADEAVALARRSCDLTDYQEASSIDTLSAAYADVGKFPEAIQAAHSALALAANNAGLKAQISEHLRAYEQGKPWRDTPIER